MRYPWQDQPKILWSVQNSYSAQFYNLEALLSLKGPMIELGRFWIHPDAQHPDIIRIAWAALAAYVDECQISMLFGCTSFAGTDTSVHQEVFELLGKRHAAPSLLAPQVKARDVFKFKRDGRRV